MKINANASQSIGKQQRSGSTDKTQINKDMGSAGVNKQDLLSSSKVSVSDKAQLMSKAKEIASKADDVNMDKVKRLQQLIDNGEYKVNSEAIADKLVDEHLML